MEYKVPDVLRSLCVDASVRVIDALAVLEETHREIVLVIDIDGRLRGTVTDGDIRRATLRGLGPEANVQVIMFHSPAVADSAMSARVQMQLMKSRRILQLPIVDATGRLVDLVLFSEIVQGDPPADKAVVMAGGKGSRLRPLTHDIPKPLLPVGEKPILETIVDQLADSGIADIYLITHYKAEMIEEHFARLNYPGCELHFVYEAESLGTAGGLGLVRDELDSPFLVMNADIISRMSFKDMLRYHVDSGAQMTVATKIQKMKIPYGVVETNGQGRIEAFVEKPSMYFTFNIGVYAVAPEVMDKVPRQGGMDMPDLIRDLIEADCAVNEYAVKDYWIDIGRMADYERACEDIIANRL